MKNSSEKQENTTSISTIQTRFERLVGTPRSLYLMAILTIQGVQDRLSALLRDEENKANSNTKLKEKVEKLPKFTGKKSKK